MGLRECPTQVRRCEGFILYHKSDGASLLTLANKNLIPTLLSRSLLLSSYAVKSGVMSLIAGASGTAHVADISPASSYRCELGNSACMC